VTLARGASGLVVLVRSVAEMGPRVAILVGLLAGILAGGALLAALVAFLPTSPAPTLAASLPPSPAAPSPSSVPSSTASVSEGPSVSAQPTPTASGSVGSPSPEESALPTPAASDEGAAFHIGEPAPTLKVAQLGGGEVDLAALRGKPVWIVFMATWCPTCLDEFPLMNGFAARYEDDGLVVVAVDVGEDVETVAAYAEQLGVMFPMGLDPQGAAAADWGVVVPPIHFFIDAEGVVRDGALGGIGSDLMAQSLRTIMPGIDVQP
jgi:cytochrome c biogenesis protein CcmG/thiol:disulfide interchange protein DsbE